MGPLLLPPSTGMNTLQFQIDSAAKNYSLEIDKLDFIAYNTDCTAVLYSENFLDKGKLIADSYSINFSLNTYSDESFIKYSIRVSIEDSSDITLKTRLNGRYFFIRDFSGPCDSFAVTELVTIKSVFLQPANLTMRIENNEQSSCRLKARHLMGTDILGRDIMARVLYGGRSTISVAISAMIISLLLGIPLGMISGYFGGISETTFRLLSYLLSALPRILIVLIFISFYGQKIQNLILIIGLTGWTEIYSVIKVVVRNLKEKEFIESSIVIGAKSSHTLIKEIFPHCLHLILIYCFYSISYNIMIESSLSFISIGVQEPYPSWGNILSRGIKMIIEQEVYWGAVFPVLFILLSVMFFYFAGDVLKKLYLHKPIRKF